MSKKRICIFCESWESGGIESFICSMLGEMDLSALEVDIVAARISDSVFTSPLQKLGVNFHQLSASLRSGKNYSLFRHLLRSRKYDLIHFNLYQGLSLYYVRIARQENIPLRIVHSHNTALRRSAGRAVKMLLHSLGKRLFARDANLLWACSEKAADFLFPASLLALRGWKFIPNGIDCARFAFNAEGRLAFRRELGLSDKLVVGSIGRLCRQKNQFFLLQAFAQLQLLHPESCLLLLGDGEMRTELEQEANRLGIADKTVFFGTTPHPEQALWAMDVLAFPSLFEGLGIVAVEAQASGLNVLCSENIPPEAHITPLCRSLSLDSGARAWGEELLRCALDSHRREGWSEELRRSGFDRADTAKLLEKHYLEGNI